MSRKTHPTQTEAVSPHLPRRLGKAADLTGRQREDKGGRGDGRNGGGGGRKAERKGRRQVRACACTSVGGKVTGDD